MAANNSSLTSDIEAFVKKAAEANKVFINEGTKLVQQMGKTGTTGKQQIPSVQPELLMDAFNSIVKLNIQHASRMIDLGIAITKKMTGQEEEAIEPENEEKRDTEIIEPAFVLKATAKAGETTSVIFLLDNIKKETIVCQLVQSDFSLQSDDSIKANVKLSFDPQAFPLEPSETKTVTIRIEVPADTTPGLYESHIQVLGFEPAFFSLYLTVN